MPTPIQSRCAIVLILRRRSLAATAAVQGRPGLLLVEATAHAHELSSDGKPLPAAASANSQRNHDRIGACLAEASTTLNYLTPGWHLAITSHYQLANRFAWAWRIATLGIPVVLVYLGFLDAHEMADVGAPFADDPAWEQAMRQHSRGIVPDSVWETPLLIETIPLIACIRTARQQLA